MWDEPEKAAQGLSQGTGEEEAGTGQRPPCPVSPHGASAGPGTLVAAGDRKMRKKDKPTPFEGLVFLWAKQNQSPSH